MQDTAFHLLKDTLTQAPVVDPSKPSILQPVAFDVGLGDKRSQVSEQGDEHPIAVASYSP